MKARNLPTIDARYWVAILAASMCGANTGDFASRILGLGHTRGLLPLALMFLGSSGPRDEAKSRRKPIIGSPSSCCVRARPIWPTS
jgi:Repeat of Unknown Function (DUF347)